MCFERITVLGSNGSDCFDCWTHDDSPKSEARQHTLISDPYPGACLVLRARTERNMTKILYQPHFKSR